MTLLRTAIERTALNIGAVAIAATMLVVPVASQGTRTALAAEGVSTQTLATVTAVENGSQLVVMRMVLEPGVRLPAREQPGSASFTVVSGILQTTLVRGGASVNRNGIELVAEIGATTNLTVGQSIVFSTRAVTTMANHGDEPLVLLASILADPDEPASVAEEEWPLFQLDLK